MSSQSNTNTRFPDYFGMVFSIFMLGGSAACAHAETSYPERPISLVIPFDAGSQPDVLGRALAEGLHATLGQSIVVVNRPGASGVIAVSSVARANPDGYTLGFGPPGQFTVMPKIQKSASYSLNDFDFICQTNAAAFMIAAGENSQIKTLQDFIEAARRKPGEISVATAGTATSPHLAIEWIAKEAKIDINHIPFKSFADMVVQTRNGNVDVIATTAAILRSQPSLVPLAAVAETRVPDFPHVATAKELGFAMEPFGSMMGMYAPKGLPRDVAQRLENACPRALEEPSVINAARITSTPVEYQNSSTYFSRLSKESEELAMLIEALNLE